MHALKSYQRLEIDSPRESITRAEGVRGAPRTGAYGKPGSIPCTGDVPREFRVHRGQRAAGRAWLGLERLRGLDLNLQRST